MTCPQCQAPVSRWAFLTASGISGIVCERCGEKLAATFESRLRLTGGGIAIGICTGGLLRSLGLDVWPALAAAASALLAWFHLRTEAILVLKRAPEEGGSVARPS